MAERAQNTPEARTPQPGAYGGKRAPWWRERAPYDCERGVICMYKERVKPRKRKELGKRARRDEICALPIAQ